MVYFQQILIKYQLLAQIVKIKVFYILRFRETLLL
jgi:hypothetical protein